MADAVEKLIFRTHLQEKHKQTGQAKIKYRKQTIDDIMSVKL